MFALRDQKHLINMPGRGFGATGHAFLFVFTMCLHDRADFCCYLQCFCVDVCVFVVVYNAVARLHVCLLLFAMFYDTGL